MSGTRESSVKNLVLIHCSLNSRIFYCNIAENNSAVPYLQSSLFSVETLFNLDYKKLDKGLDDNAYFWNFLAGLEVETNGMQLLKQHYQWSTLKMTNYQEVDM